MDQLYCAPFLFLANQDIQQSLWFFYLWQWNKIRKHCIIENGCSIKCVTILYNLRNPAEQKYIDSDQW